MHQVNNIVFGIDFSYLTFFRTFVCPVRVSKYSCTKTVYQKKWYIFLICIKNSQYVPKKWYMTPRVPKYFGTRSDVYQNSYIYSMLPCIISCIIFLIHIVSCTKNVVHILIHIAICIIFSIHEHPCIKTIGVPKYFDTYRQYFRYITVVYQKYDTYLDTGTPISIHSNLVTIYLQFDKLNPSWYRHVCTLAMVEISVQYCTMNCPSCNSTWPYLRGGSPKPDLRPSITAQPGRYLSVNADSLPAHLILSVQDKMPVLTGTMVLYSTCKEETWIRCFQARGLGMPSCPSRTMCPSRSESWNGSRITRYEKNEEHTTISDVYKTITQNDTPNDTSIHTRFWYTEPCFDTPFSTANWPINSICWGLSHFVELIRI